LALRPVKGGVGPAGMRQATGLASVAVLKDEKAMPADSAHGLTPGDRSRGAVARFAAEWVKLMGPSAEPAKEVRLPRERIPRRALPRFDAAAFAEEW
jgi:hypothetical protein